MFDQLGGEPARAAAGACWSAPGAATRADDNRCCRQHDNTRPADADGRARTVLNEEILYTSAAGEQQTMSLLPGLAQAQCPVLVMAGVLDPVCPLADAEDVAAALPPRWRQFAHFEHSGHGAWRDEPAAAFARLRAFITAP